MKIEKTGALLVSKEEVDSLIRFFKKSLIVPSKENNETECFDEFIQALKTISGEFDDHRITV